MNPILQSLIEAKQENSGICTAAVKITPEMAKIWLGTNIHNRKVMKTAVGRYADIMSAGKWVMNGETIIFDWHGNLIQGQHRLKASVESGSSFPSVVVYGIDPEAFATIDQGVKRTAGQIFSIMGVKNYNHVASMLSNLYKFLYVSRQMTGGGRNPTAIELIELYVENKDSVNKSAQFGVECRSLLPYSVSGFCHYLFSEKDPLMADSVFRQIADGFGLTFDDPIGMLRNRLIDNRASKARLGNRDLMAIIIKAWNYKRSGKKLKCLKFTALGDSKEKFPEVM